MTTAPGIFSPARLDKGTAVLLEKAELPTLPADATIVDLGCGWGPITLAMADYYPHARVYGVDVNERALDLARKNVAAAGLTNAEVGTDAPAEIDFLISNPPIRIGKEPLHELLVSWLTRLKVGGQAQLVVQHNLGSDSLAAWLTDQGFPTEKLASKKGFRVLQVSARR